MDLIEQHLLDLRKSALDDRTIELMAVRSVVGADCASVAPILSQCDSLLEIPYFGDNGFRRWKVFPPIATASGEIRYYQQPGSSNHLYTLRSVTSRVYDPSVPLIVVEGEKKEASLAQRGHVGISISGLWSWKETGESWEGIDELKKIPFVDREVLIVPDSDVWTQRRVDLQKAVFSLGKYLEAVGAKVSVAVLPIGVDKMGADDYFAAGHTVEEFDELRRLRLKDPPLGQHKKWYGEWKEIRDAQPRVEKKNLPSFMIDVEPCAEPVDGAELLDEIGQLIRQYVVLSEDALHAVTLWILHAWLLNAFDLSPLLFITSATKRCGKTRLLETIAPLSPRPLIAGNITGPALFRIVDQCHPTFCLDEADTFIREREELRGIINAGHRRSTSFVARTVGDDHAVKLFSTWAPKVIAAIDKIGETLEDRSIIVQMKRRAPDESVRRFRAAEYAVDADRLRSKAARFVADNIEKLRTAKPEAPDQLNDRAVDNWSALFAIADLAGPEWSQRARSAALVLCEDLEESDDCILIDLLREFKELFAKRDRISSADLVQLLNSNPDGRWVEYGDSRKPITQRQVAKILSPVKIRPRTIKLKKGSEETIKGYLAEWFRDVICRYHPEKGDYIRHQRHPAANKEQFHQNDTSPKEAGDVSELPENINENITVTAVTDREPVSRGLDKNDDSLCRNCSVQMGIQGRIDGRLDHLCPKCAAIREAANFVEPVKLPSSLDRFREIIFFDLEFYCPSGSNPSPHCAVFREVRSGRTVELLREEFPAASPFSTEPDALWIAYSGSSDLRCFLSVGWALPENYIDLCTESKLRFNSPGPDRGLPKLTESLDRFGITHIDAVEKKKSQKRYAKPELTDEDRRDVLPYCSTDVDPLPELFLKLFPDLDLSEALSRGAFVVETSVIEQRGIPISAEDYEKISANRERIKLDLIKQSPVGPEIYDSKGSFSFKRFGEWLKKNEIDGWAATSSGRLCMTEQYLAEVASVAPIAKPFVDLALALKDFKKIPFSIGPDGRSHCDQQPFNTITGRNAASRFVLLGAKFWRWLVRAEKPFALVNADFSNEEYACAAFLSGDPNMIAGYALPDVYQSVADQLGVTRKIAKVAMLAIQYGARPKRLESAGVPLADAKRIFEYHKDTHSQYWRWSDACVEQLKVNGIFSVGAGDGWALRFDGDDTGNTFLTARNFLIQATAAAILRRCVLDAAEEGIEIIGPLHDSILAQMPLHEAKEHAEKLCELMRAASGLFLNGNEVRVAFHIYEDRFEDPDGREDWNRVSKILQKYK
jgi:Protein of unknown function (DUF3631)/DNA polymerase family A/Domain of unknown function (DUF3854)